jgi:DNA-binding NarL/FixJ family response regulator
VARSAVLVIDRLALVRRALRTALGAIDVLEAAGVEEALLVAGGRRPDVVVVGPGQAATAVAEMVRRLHEALPGVPVLVMTARS